MNALRWQGAKSGKPIVHVDTPVGEKPNEEVLLITA